MKALLWPFLAMAGLVLAIAEMVNPHEEPEPEDYQP